jgi:hypothetical protein
LAAACVLIALAMTQQGREPTSADAVVIVPATQMQVCGTTVRDHICALPAG